MPAQMMMFCLALLIPIAGCGPNGLRFGLPPVPPGEEQKFYNVTFNWSGYAILEMDANEKVVQGNDTLTTSVTPILFNSTLTQVSAQADVEFRVRFVKPWIESGWSMKRSHVDTQAVLPLPWDTAAPR